MLSIYNKKCFICNNKYSINDILEKDKTYLCKNCYKKLKEYTNHKSLSNYSNDELKELFYKNNIDNNKAEIDKILSKLPFNKYSDLFNAIINGKATLKIMRSDCYQIANINHPYCNMLMLIGFLISTILIIFLAFYYRYYGILFFIPINFLLTYIICFFPMLKHISWIALLCDLFVFKLPYFIFVESICIIVISFFYNIWWKKTYKYAIYELQFNENAFLWSWNRYGLGIEDCYGNIYNKFNIDNEEKIDSNYSTSLKYDILLELLQKNLNLTEIDDIIHKISNFYIENDIEIPNNLINTSNLTEDEKRKNLLNIFEIGLGVTGIDNVLPILENFYSNQTGVNNGIN